jgi:LPS export ABC transporter protein LptC
VSTVSGSWGKPARGMVAVPAAPRGRRRAGTARRLARVLALGLAAVVPALTACGGSGHGVASIDAAADSADQVMWGVRYYLTDQGVRQAFLQADSAWEYEATGRVDLKHIHVTFYSAEGVQESVLTGDAGTYWTRTNQMSARGNVVVVRTSDQARLRTDFLEYDPNKNEVRTDRPYVADKGDRHMAGVGFNCDPSFVNCHTTGARGSAGQLVMPER